MRKWTLVGLMCLLSNGVSALMQTHDVMNFNRAFEILRAGREQVEAARRVHEELSSTKNLIGNIKNTKEDILKDLSSWRFYYDKLDVLDTNDFSAMSWLGLDRAAPQNHAAETFKLLDNKFFGTNVIEEPNNEDYLNKVNMMSYEREKVAKNSIITGILASEKSKNNLGDAKLKIMNATNKSLNASDLISVMQVQNEMLGVIATELVQQRELQSQMLEFLVAQGSLTHPLGNNQKPKNIKVKSVF